MRNHHPSHAHHVKAHGPAPDAGGLVPPSLSEVMVSDPAVLHGLPVFAETVVPIEVLLEYRRAGAPLYEFLVDFPAVRRAHAKRVWAWMEKSAPGEIRKVLAHVKSHPDAPHSHHYHSKHSSR